MSFINVFGAIYQFERECSKERQREGIDLALGALIELATGNK
jgi:DNA invertase Pin-like site-specific DNA recombinase